MTFEKVKDLIVDTLSCEADEVTLDSNLFDDLGADSLDAVELNISLEEVFGVSVPDDDLPNIKTVKDIVDFIDSHQ